MWNGLPNGIANAFANDISKTFAKAEGFCEWFFEWLREWTSGRALAPNRHASMRRERHERPDGATVVGSTGMTKLAELTKSITSPFFYQS